MTRQQGRRWALVVGILLVFGLGFLTSECQARQRATPDRVTVRVIDDGAKGGPAVVATQVVPLR
jgi:hypothetical protein